MGQVDAVAQSSVQQQLAATRQKAIPIDRNLVASCHCLIPEGFKLPTYSRRGWPALAAPLGCSDADASRHETPTPIVRH
jgi:hypothetical protein